MAEQVTYFAYGSNLCLARLRFRVPSVKLIAAADLRGFALKWHKRSHDGSGKCSIYPRAKDIVHGALFSIAADELHLLDHVEGRGKGYARQEVKVMRAGHEVNAATYIAQAEYVDPALVPYRWYRDLVLCGARTLDLPEDYVTKIADLKTVSDTNEERSRTQRQFLCESCR